MSEKIIPYENTKSEADYIPYIPSDEVVVKRHSDLGYEHIKELNSNLEKAKEGRDQLKIDSIEQDLRDSESIGKYILDAEIAQQDSDKKDMTVSDILAKRALVAQSRIEKWQKDNSFPAGWENAQRERDLIGIAIDQLGAVKDQMVQAGHFMVNPDKLK